MNLFFRLRWVDFSTHRKQQIHPENKEKFPLPQSSIFFHFACFLLHEYVSAQLCSQRMTAFKTICIHARGISAFNAQHFVGTLTCERRKLIFWNKLPMVSIMSTSSRSWIIRCRNIFDYSTIREIRNLFIKSLLSIEGEEMEERDFRAEAPLARLWLYDRDLVTAYW